MNDNNISFISQSHYIGEFLSDVEWKLTNDKLIRYSQKKGETSYLLSDINSIRLCFHMGGRGTPAKYCCYFSYQSQTNNKQFFSAKAIVSSMEYKNYYQLVSELAENAKKHNKSLVLIAGHGTFSWLFYLITCIALLLLPYFTYKNHIINYNESMWATLIILLLCSPMVTSMIKYFPRTIKLQHIPKNVLPKPKEAEILNQ